MLVLLALDLACLARARKAFRVLGFGGLGFRVYGLGGLGSRVQGFRV